MLAAGSIAVFFTALGVCRDFWAVIITASIMMIPGIPLVNSVRNLFCGNEMNGILGLFKVLLETLTIVLGLVLSIYLFGEGIVV